VAELYLTAFRLRRTRRLRLEYVSLDSLDVRAPWWSAKHELRL
jgi:hypothetical protein